MPRDKANAEAIGMAIEEGLSVAFISRLVAGVCLIFNGCCAVLP